MFIVYDRTWQRNLCYGRFSDKTGPVLLEVSQDGSDPISIFRTKKSAYAAIDATKSYTSAGVSLSWTKNDYVILPVKLERKK